MKKLIAVGLSLALLVSSAGCASKVPQVNQIEETTAVTEPVVVVTDEVRKKLDEALVQNQFEGIVCLTHNGEVVYESVSGVNDLGEPLTMESPMYIASVSKQFCAAAILILRDQGKLSLDDTLDQYFPEYELAKQITIKNLLNMQSGLPRDPEVLESVEEYLNCTEEENMVRFCQWAFGKPLKFTPGTKHDYSNINYNLLSLIIERVSGEAYESFIRKNIFEPLGMTHSGFMVGVQDQPDWAQGLDYTTLDPILQIPGADQGCGDIATTAADMDIWMTALQSGQVICEESYQEMTTMVDGYGYGLEAGIRGGLCHGGDIPEYHSMMYFNREHGYNLFVVAGNISPYKALTPVKTSHAILRILFEATDAAYGN